MCFSTLGLPSSLHQEAPMVGLNRRFNTALDSQQSTTQNLSPPSSTHNTENGASQRLRDDQQQNYQVSSLYLEPLSPATSSLDFMHLPSQGDKQQTTSRELQLSSSDLIDPMIFQSSLQRPQCMGMDSTQGLAFGLHMDGSNTELPIYIDELLSGACMY